jgi:hypothetical protein
MGTPEPRQRGYFPTVALRDALLVFIALSGYLYYCYKFGSPNLGNNDFYRYKEMVEHPFDLSVVPAPFVLRQIPTLVADIFNLLGVSYDTQTNFDLLRPADTDAKRIFFDLILSNSIAAGTAIVVSMDFIRKQTSNNGITICFAYIGIMLSYFYFPFSVIAPLTTGWGWLATSMLAVALFERRLLLLLFGCVVALLSRETVLIFMLVFSAIAWVSFARLDWFYLRSTLLLAASCGALILARTYLVHGYEDQFDLHANLQNLLSFRPSQEFILQAVVPQALIFMLLLSVSPRYGLYAVALLTSMLAVAIVGIGAGERPGGIGRAIGETLPLYAIIFLLLNLGTPPFYSRVAREEAS